MSSDKEQDELGIPPVVALVDETAEAVFRDAVVQMAEDVEWGCTDNKDTSHCRKMPGVIEALVCEFGRRSRHMMYVPLDVLCPPMAPISISTEKRHAITSRWRFCLACYKPISQYGRLALLIVTGIANEKRSVGWHPMLACLDCTYTVSSDCCFFPWVATVAGLWQDAMEKALNSCPVCLKPTDGGKVCSDVCEESAAFLEQNDSREGETDDLRLVVLERMRCAEVSLYSLLFSSQCTVVKGCFVRARGCCPRCGKAAYCAHHKKEGEQHVHEGKCKSHLKVWKTENFVDL